MVTYASYFKPDTNLRHTALNVTILDTQAKAINEAMKIAAVHQCEDDRHRSHAAHHILA